MDDPCIIIKIQLKILRTLIVSLKLMVILYELLQHGKEKCILLIAAEEPSNLMKGSTLSNQII